jgi:SAM-dependent methyltransferase
MTIDAKGPNAEQITYWNETFGERWVEQQEMLDSQIGALGRAAQERAAVRPGERVLDVGCGCGQSALELAERVGPGGSVLGIDLSSPMLARARERAAALAHVSFENADAQIHPFEAASFDLVFSRFGVMFFADPPAAFANLRRALVPGGRLSFVCWQAAPRNQWILVPMMAIAQHVPLPPPPEPGAPGPMSLADPDHARGILEKAGFEDVGLEELETELAIGGGGSLDAATDFLMRMGPASRALRDVDDDRVAAARAAVREALAPFASDDGVRMAGACWIVSARNAA